MTCLEVKLISVDESLRKQLFERATRDVIVRHGLSLLETGLLNTSSALAGVVVALSRHNEELREIAAELLMSRPPAPIVIEKPKEST